MKNPNIAKLMLSFWIIMALIQGISFTFAAIYVSPWVLLYFISFGISVFYIKENYNIIKGQDGTNTE